MKNPALAVHDTAGSWVKSLSGISVVGRDAERLVASRRAQMSATWSLCLHVTQSAERFYIGTQRVECVCPPCRSNCRAVHTGGSLLCRPDANRAT